MKCANCGAEIKLGCVYCSVCGKEAQIVPDYNVEEDILKELLEEYNIRKMLNEIVSIYDEITDDFEEDAGEINEFIQVIMQLAIKEDNTLYTEEEIYEFLKMYARDTKEQQKDEEIYGSIKEDEYGEITFIDDPRDAIAFGRR